MADRRRIVTLDATGTPTTVIDLEDLIKYSAVAGSFQVKPPERHPMLAQRPRRYGGAITVGETHDNGAVTWKSLMKGTTADNAMLNVEAALSVLEAPRRDLYFEWRADGVTGSVFFKVMGPATWTPAYDWAQFQGGQSLYMDVVIPIAPLGVAAPSTVAIASTSLPAVVSLGTIPGDAPALADVILDHGNGTGLAPVFAMIAWTPTPSAPSSGVAPWGVIEAETGSNLGSWAVTANASYRGGSGLRGTAAAGSGTFTASYTIDPDTMTADDFADGDVDIEIWGKFEFGGQQGVKIAVSLLPSIGSANGKFSYTEFGSAGKTMVQTSGFPFRYCKLGTISMPVDKTAGVVYTLKVAVSYTTGSSQPFGMDYLILNPLRSRALSPTGKPNDSTYPVFIVGNVSTRKKIRGEDLSGYVGAGGSGTLGRDTGLGGSPIELPTGSVQMLLKLSSMVPDDPTLSSTSEQLAHTVSGSVVVWPRYFLAKGA